MRFFDKVSIVRDTRIWGDLCAGNDNGEEMVKEMPWRLDNFLKIRAICYLIPITKMIKECYNKCKVSKLN